jgi:C-terminal processing protease CtpA/Prc
VFVLVLALATAMLPARAQETGSGPRIITGSYATTNPIYPTIGADIGIALYELTGKIQNDYNFTPPPASQVIGRIEGNIVSGDYTITLPERPQGTPLDFDDDPASPPAVQVYVTATYIEFLGEDATINRGESALDMSVALEPMTFDITGGHVIVWTSQAGEQFPAGLGPDGALFTGDEPLLALPAGWSVVALDGEPFTVLRDEQVDVALIESVGALNDYSDLDARAAWDRLFERTRLTYPFTDDKDLDWDAIYAQITPVVEETTTLLEFHLAIAQFGALIPDMHVGYVSPLVLQQFLLGGFGIGELAITDTGEVVVMHVVPGTAAAEAGIQAGDVLVSVDGTDALQALDDTPLLLTSASTPHARRYLQAATLLQGTIGSQVALTWRSPDGSPQTQTFTRQPDFTSILRAFDTGDPGARVIEGRMLDSGIGYINVRGFAQDVSQAEEWFSAELQALVDAGAKGLIIDVRDNGGGLINLAMALAGHFFPDHVRLFDLYYADGAGGFAYRGYIEIIAGTPYYAGPVAVLVNAMTGSAGDMFAYAMDYDDRALIVGQTPTGGFTGEVSDGQYTLPGELSVQMPTGRPVHPDTGATLLEGVGVAPDVDVPITLQSLRSPEDEVLQAAEAALLGQ